MPALSLEPGDPRQLGPYNLINRLGSGGQGVVFLGQRADQALVAIKVLHHHADAGARARLAREVAAARRVPQFYTAAVLDASVEAERPYIVSEYVEGSSLQERVAERGPLTGGTLHLVAVNTAHALDAIHGAGVIHRDLKPGNVQLGPAGPVVVDFGIARPADADTHTGQLIGTPAYLTPEQLDGRPATEASDVFAWAGTIVFAATGHPPFGGAEESIHLVMRRIVTGGPDLTGVPEALVPLLAECLSKDPADRPTARRLIERLTGGGRGAPRPPGAGAANITRDQERPPPARPEPEPEPEREPASEREPEREPEPDGARPEPEPEPAPEPGRPEPEPPGGGRREPGPVRPAPAPPPDPMPPGPRTDPGSTRRPPRRARWPVIGGVVLAAALVGAIVTGVATVLDGDSGGSTGSAEGIPASFAGTWEGTVLRNVTTGTRSSRARIPLVEGQRSAAADYPDWGCSGQLALREAAEDELEFDLDITSGNCTAGVVRMVRVDDRLEYRWEAGGDTTSGTLTRG